MGGTSPSMTGGLIKRGNLDTDAHGVGKWHVKRKVTIRR